MWIALIFTLLGLALVFIEFFVPGGIIALIGGFCIVFGIIAFCLTPVPLLYKIAFCAGACATAAGACSFALHIIKKQKKPSLYLNRDQEGFTASSFEKELIGLQGVALSDLKPSGHIEVEGKRYHALSERLYLEKGTPVIVEGGRGAYLIVRTQPKEKV